MSRLSLSKLKSNLTRELKQYYAHSGRSMPQSAPDLLFPIESFLHFCYIHGFKDHCSKRYGLLSGLHKMGRKHLKPVDYQLDNLRRRNDYFSSRMRYKEVLQNYINLPESFRMYTIDPNTDHIILLETGRDWELRKLYYNQLALEAPTSKKTSLTYDPDIKKYWFKYKNSDIHVSLETIDLPERQEVQNRKKKGGAIVATLQELILAASEMDRLIDQKKMRPQNFQERMKKVALQAFENNHLKDIDQINIHEICNVLGLVGSGKSTLMQVLAFYAVKKSYRLCLVFETTRQVLDMAIFFEALGIRTAAINGATTIQDQLDKCTHEGEMFLKSEYAEHLNGLCLLDGWIDRQSMWTTLAYGREPCFQLMSEGKNTKYLCPFYPVCPRKKDFRSIGTADLIVTNVYSFVQGRTYIMEDSIRDNLLNTALRSVDLVIFDESDQLQIKLDEIFCQKASSREILDSHRNSFQQETGRLIEGNTSPLASKFELVYVHTLNYLNEIRNLIVHDTRINSLPTLNNGRWFSGLLMTREFFNQKIFSKKLSDDLDDFNLRRKEILLFVTFRNTLIFDQNVTNVLDLVKNDYHLDDRQLVFFQFTLTLILFEKSLFQLSTILQELSEAEPDEAERLEIFRAPRRSLLKLIPTSPLGNLFGYIYDKEKQDIEIFRQFGIGRCAMLDLPWLEIDQKGRAMGPNVLLLSGSSWAHGSARYHIARPISYVLKSSADVRRFANQTSIKVVPSSFKVSGRNNKEQAIEALIRDKIALFADQLSKSGRMLVIVNSYGQCRVAQDVFQGLIPEVPVFRLIPDTASETDGGIRRSKLNHAADDDFKILIAPAASIGRGFNMIDANGHSLFSSLFFLVRPMSPPDEIVQTISVINGALYDFAARQDSAKPVGERIQALEKLAHKLWQEEFVHYYSIGNLKPRRKMEIVVSRVVLIMQLFGRLLRITDINRDPPKIFFVDGAFSGKEFDLLKEIKVYLERNINRKDVGQIVDLLYGPIYYALIGGSEHDRIYSSTRISSPT